MIFLLRHLKAFLTAACFCATLIPASAQYLHVDNKRIVDKNGNEVILHGMGLGGWMLQEGYMLETGDFAGPQHKIRAKIAELIGPANTQEFYDAWLANHCTKRDIDSLAAWGFNSVRLPMHYNLYTLPIEQEPVAGQNTWLEKGFAMTDELLAWCEANHMYLILDLHAAPGGQGHDANISDYDNTKPSLWESEANKQKTIALWRKLAERYANEEWIGGYDLINEPNWNFDGANPNGCNENVNAPLRKLFVDITAAIRQVDQNHIIFIEGNCWGNNYNGMFPKWDNNMGASFHKYWNFTDQNSIQFALNIRDQQNMPVWLGETGENSNNWFTNTIRTLEANKIGYAWWPMKKVGSVVNPLTVKKNDDYNTLLRYWKGEAGVPQPTVDFAKTALMQLAENLKIENTIYRKDVTDAMFRQVTSSATIPFAENTIPGVIHLSDFDLGRCNKAYFDLDTATYQVSTQTYTAWNSGWSYRNDGVDIEASTDADPNSNGFNLGWTQNNEWTQYTLAVDSTAAYTVTLRYALQGGSSVIRLKANGADIAPFTTLTPTGGSQTWGNAVFENVILYKGQQKLRLFFEKGGANVGFAKFELSKKLSEVPFTVVSAETSSDGSVLYLNLNKKLDAATLTGSTGFTVKVGGTDVMINSIQPHATIPNQVILTINKALIDSDVINILYNGNTVKATDETLLSAFTITVANKLPIHVLIPAKIEAENFNVNVGLQLETTTDAGGGQNVGYTNAGDYLDYLIRVPADGNYPLEVRVACNNQSGIIQMEQRTAQGEVLNTVNITVPVTGGWQTWQTVKTRMKLTAGSTTLRLKILQPEFNLNWFRFLQAEIISGTEKKRQSSLNIYPNPADKYLNIEVPEKENAREKVFTIRSSNGSAVRNNRESNNDNVLSVYVGDLPAGLYFIELNGREELWRGKFVVKK